MMTLHPPTTNKRLVEPTFAAEFPPALVAASQQLSEQLAASYPREVRPSELKPYDASALRSALAQMGIYVR